MCAIHPRANTGRTWRAVYALVRGVRKGTAFAAWNMCVLYERKSIHAGSRAGGANTKIDNRNIWGGAVSRPRLASPLWRPVRVDCGYTTALKTSPTGLRGLYSTSGTSALLSAYLRRNDAWIWRACRFCSSCAKLG